jgi:8-oxo-dGTP pyrophosphatase MutT (NUDIX family)/phosphohistidine phosphatase SixA
VSRNGAKKTILAGGAVVQRVRPGKDAEILVIHRQRYSDWTLPKGKVEAGESVVAAAAREVREETGVRIRLGTPLDTICYPLGSGATKEVRYWTGQPLDAVKRAPDDEVDVVSWLPLKAALQRLTFAHDKDLVRQLVDQPPTTTLMLVRHGKAMDRKDWSKKDTLRPMRARGRKQARQLIPFLDAYGIEHLISSSSTRCVTTLEPYAELAKVGIETHETLTEEVGTADPDAVERLVGKIREGVLASATPTAICVHRPVLPSILQGLDLAPANLATGEMLVAHMTADGVHAIERHRPQA